MVVFPNGSAPVEPPGGGCKPIPTLGPHLPHTYIIFCKLRIDNPVDDGISLQCRYNGHDGVSNHQPHDGLLNRLFRCRSKETSKLRVAGLCVGNSPGPVNSLHKGPVTRKMLPFDDVIMSLASRQPASVKKYHTASPIWHRRKSFFQW